MKTEMKSLKNLLSLRLKSASTKDVATIERLRSVSLVPLVARVRRQAQNQ